MGVIWPQLSKPNQDQDYVYNMDWTPTPFTYISKKTYEIMGRKTIHIRKSTNDMKKVTTALTITASGCILTPFLIFKGSPKGRIVRYELPNFSKGCVYACQENAWMD